MTCEGCRGPISADEAHTYERLPTSSDPDARMIVWHTGCLRRRGRAGIILWGLLGGLLLGDWLVRIGLWMVGF